MSSIPESNIFIGNLFENISEVFDHVVSNPPIKVGKKYLLNFVDQSYERLDDKGTLTLVIKKNLGADSLKKYLISKSQIRVPTKPHFSAHKTPQILKYPTKIEGELFARQYYMGLQEEVSNAEKNKQFWDAVAERDRAYVKLETNMVRVLAELKDKYGEVDFVSDNVSSNYTNPPQKF